MTARRIFWTLMAIPTVVALVALAWGIVANVQHTGFNR